MPLESLLEQVETLRNRAETHRDALQASEALTRYALIDPLLRELGWDTADPAMVAPEYRVPNNQIADYVLFNEDRPVIVVESKKLDEPLQSGRALDQGILYCAHTGAKYFLLTDGKQWQIYESGSTKPVIDFDLLNQPPAEFCLNALALWRPSVQAGYVAPSHTPIISSESSERQLAATNRSQGTGSTALPTDKVMPPPGDSQPLTSVESGGPKPAEMWFPDGHWASLKYWYDLPLEAVNWLSRKGLLTPSHCPIKLTDRSKRYIVHTKPTQMDGQEFKNPKQAGDYYVMVNRNSKAGIRGAIAIINHVGQDPAQFKVRFD